jgi:hypothetical protein
MTLAAPDLRFFDIAQGLRAHGRDVNVSAEAKKPRGHSGFENEVRTSIGHGDSGDRAGCAEFRLPRSAVRSAINQAAFLLISTAEEVFIVEGAFAARRSSHGTCRSNPRQVCAGACVNSYEIAGLNKQGDLNPEAGLRLDHLCGSGGGVPFDSVLGFYHLQVNRSREIDIQCFVAVEGQFDRQVLLQVVNCLPQGRPVQDRLFISVGIHEVVQIAVVIEELGHTIIETHVLDPISGNECLFQHRPRAEIAHLGSNGGFPSTGLVVGVLDDLEQFSIEVEGHATPQVVDVYQGDWSLG